MSRVLAFLCCLTIPILVLADGPRRRDRGREIPRPGTLVRVEQTNGPTLTGHLDPSTNDRTVVLRSELPGIVLKTRIPRNSVRSVRNYTAPANAEVPFADRRRPVLPDERLANRDTRVRSLEISAGPINWDEDAAIDGLRLYVLPLNTAGEIVPAGGTLNVELVARRFSNYREDDTISAVERWSRQIKAKDFGPDGAVVDLEFDRIEPEKDFNLIPVGQLNVEYGISGQKVLRATQVEVWFRPPSYIRDELQLHTGSREFRPRDRQRRFPGR